MTRLCSIRSSCASGPPRSIQTRESTPLPFASKRAAHSKSGSTGERREGGALTTFVSLDPYTGEKLGARDWGEVSLARKDIILFLYRLHYTLALPASTGRLGNYLLGVTALVWTIDCFVSAYLTLPQQRREKRVASVQILVEPLEAGLADQIRRRRLSHQFRHSSRFRTLDLGDAARLRLVERRLQSR